MRSHARAEAPRECCGLLIGADGRIDRAHPARNLHENAARFLVDPADHFAALRIARSVGLDVVGAYHSHVRSAALPSPTDLAEWQNGNLLCVILSLASEPPAVRAFRLTGMHYEEIELVAV